MMDFILDRKHVNHLVPGEYPDDWQQTMDRQKWNPWTRDKALEIITILEA